MLILHFAVLLLVHGDPMWVFLDARWQQTLQINTLFSVRMLKGGTKIDLIAQAHYTLSEVPPGLGTDP